MLRFPQISLLRIAFPLLRPSPPRWWPFWAALLAMGALGAAGYLGVNLATLLGVGLTGVLALVGLGMKTPAMVLLVLLLPTAWHFSVQLPRAARALWAVQSVQSVQPVQPVQSVPPVPSLQSAQTAQPLEVPAAGQVGAQPEPPPIVRLEGTIRERELLPAGSGQLTQGADTPHIRLLLGEVRLWANPGAPNQAQRQEALQLAEVEVVFPAKSAWPYRARRRLRLGGVSARMDWSATRMRILFHEVQSHFKGESTWFLSGQALRLKLRDRAGYYLGKSTLAVYLPVLLGVRERTTPEAREVTGAFRRVGVSHLFAISGLHVGLLFLLLFAVQEAVYRLRLGRLGATQGSVHGRLRGRVLVVLLIWAYIGVIGFPVPAVRAAMMGTMLVWSGMWGTRTPRSYILCLAALVLLAWEPTLLHDLSFQMSFLAYAFLITGLSRHPRLPAFITQGVFGKLGKPGKQGQSVRGVEGASTWAGLVAKKWGGSIIGAIGMNVWLTTLITLGLWPVLMSTFGQVPLLVFLGNLVMVPLLSLLVLPVGLVALLASLLNLGGPPGGFLEQSTFSLLEGVLSIWVLLVKGLDQLGGHLMAERMLEWKPQMVLAYYTVLLGLMWLFTQADHKIPQEKSK